MTENKYILFGGTSDEANVSLNSCKFFVRTLENQINNYNLIYLDRDLNFYLVDAAEIIKVESLKDINYKQSIFFVRNGFILKENFNKFFRIDLILSLIHGEAGEDGNIQGFLNILNISYTGCGINSSSLCINKYLTKIYLEKEGIPVCKSLKYFPEISVGKVEEELGFPVIIKPTSLGSSIGVSVANEPKDFERAILESLKISDSLMIEKFLEVRELECAVLQLENDIILSEVGETIKLNFHIYTYEEKYLNNNFSSQIPAKIPKNISDFIKTNSKKIFLLLNCKGYARVDFFLDNNNKIYFNEINTIPGFTDISMYPKLLENSGISNVDLIHKMLIKN